MTRLTSNQVKPIINTLDNYDRELKSKIGVTLKDAAKHAVAAGPETDKHMMQTKTAVVPITAGHGIIEGFSEAVAAILKHIGLKAFITSTSDVAGFVEALEDGASVIFAADEKIFAAFNLITKNVVDNSEATGLAYAAALELASRGVSGKKISVIGVGRVGSAVIDYLLKKGATIYVVDVDTKKITHLKKIYKESIIPCKSIKIALDQTNLVLLTADFKGAVITEDMVRKNMIISAPAVPLGLTKNALAKLPQRSVIHDPLQLGVATMALAVLNR